MIVGTTKEQRAAARQASVLNYEDKRNCPDRAGWTWGKCPVQEYFGKVAELAAANFMGYPSNKICLYSSSKADYTKPDMGDWDVKAGNTFSGSDIAKGVKRILWVKPLNNGSTFYCGYETCKVKVHSRLSGAVEIIGWTDLADINKCRDMGSYYKVTPQAIRPVDTIVRWAA